MTKIKIYTIKKNLIPLTILAFTVCLLVFSSTNLPAVKKGLALFGNGVVPSLLPFFIATELLMHTDIVSQLGRILNPIMKPLFNVNGKGAFAFVMGLISGYPVGAKIATNFRKNNICSKEECERLLSFTNNSGPLFIIGTVGISMFGNTTIGILLFITHLLASLCVGFIFRFWKYGKSTYLKNSQSSNYSNQKENVTLSNLGEVMAESITSSISTILMIGGFIVIFSAVISILEASGIVKTIIIIFSPIFNYLDIDVSFIRGLFTGFFEITNGINSISNIHIKNISINIMFSSFLLGFGGISVMLQVLSIISKTDLSAKPYIMGKLLHGVISVILVYFFIKFIPVFNFDLH